MNVSDVLLPEGFGERDADVIASSRFSIFFPDRETYERFIQAVENGAKVEQEALVAGVVPS